MMGTSGNSHYMSSSFFILWLGLSRLHPYSFSYKWASGPAFLMVKIPEKAGKKKKYWESRKQ